MSVAIELFGGAGCAGLGLRRAGVEAVGIELDADACATRTAAGLATIRADVITFPLGHLAGRVSGIWASPPCTDFSRAGKRAGLKGRTGPLVWEPLRWAEALRPKWMACEETEDVLPIWHATAARLRQLGYSTWCGMLQAADYGVPQCRKRAILMASRIRAVHPPTPTHAQHPHPDLFGNPPLLRWRTMAEGLGWTASDGLASERSARTVCGHRTPRWLYTGSNTELGCGMVPYLREVERPAPVVDGKAGTHWRLTSPRGSYGAEPRVADPYDQPAPTVALGHHAAEWIWKRPSTTVQGTDRIARPGHHARQWADSVPVSLEELAVLQGYPTDWPFVGNKTSVARQIGNAVPPALAEAVVRSLTGAEALSERSVA